MRLAANRVNLTSSSIAQCNYVKLLDKHQSTEKGIHNIVTLLGLQSDDLTYLDFDTKVRRKRRRLFRKSTSLRSNWEIVQYVVRRLSIRVNRTVKWYRVAVIKTRRKFYQTIVECDLKSGVIIMTMRRHCDDESIYNLELSGLHEIINGIGIVKSK